MNDEIENAIHSLEEKSKEVLSLFTSQSEISNEYAKLKTRREMYYDAFMDPVVADLLSLTGDKLKKKITSMNMVEQAVTRIHFSICINFTRNLLVCCKEGLLASIETDACSSCVNAARSFLAVSLPV